MVRVSRTASSAQAVHPERNDTFRRMNEALFPASRGRWTIPVGGPGPGPRDRPEAGVSGGPLPAPARAWDARGAQGTASS